MTGGWFMKFMALILPTKNTKLPVWNETDDTDDTCYIYIYIYIYTYIYIFIFRAKLPAFLH